MKTLKEHSERLLAISKELCDIGSELDPNYRAEKLFLAARQARLVAVGLQDEVNRVYSVIEKRLI